MKNVLRTSKEVCQYWAEQRQPSARVDNIFYEGPRIYSYGPHFCMARILPNGVAVFTTRTYSPTTTHHVTLAVRAAREAGRAIVYCRAPERCASLNREEAASDIDEAMAASEAPRIRHATRVWHQMQARHFAEQFNAYLAALPDNERGDVKPLAVPEFGQNA